MDRAKTNTDDTTPTDKATTAAKAEPAPAPAATTAPSTAAASDQHEPFPGPAFFHGGRNSPIVQALAVRLRQEGHWDSAQSTGPDWTNTHKRAVASYQHELRPKEGGDVSGIPDQVMWDRLQVPRVSPRTDREA